MTEFRQSDVAPLGTVLLKGPREACGTQEAADGAWRALGWTAPPDLDAAAREHEAFAEILEEAGARLHFLPPSGETGLDSIYARDASVVCERGAVLCRMGKAARRGEPAAQEAAYRELGIPVLGLIRPPGTLEGGDVVWLDDRTVAVGRGYRTNDAGIAQLRELLGDAVDEIVVVPLPHWRGPEDVFHLMSILSPVDRDLFVVYSPLLPVPFRETLVERGYELVEVPEDELDTLGCNVLAVAPRRCVMVEGNPRTRARLEAAGARVTTFEAGEVCLKGRGGPTCLARPAGRRA